LPKGYIDHLSPSEFAVLIAGSQKIDVAEMKETSEGSGYSKTDDQFIWFWEVLEEFS